MRNEALTWLAFLLPALYKYCIIIATGLEIWMVITKYWQCYQCVVIREAPMQDVNVMTYKSSITLMISLFFMVMDKSILLVYSKVYSTSSAAYVHDSVHLCSKIEHFVQKHPITFVSYSTIWKLVYLICYNHNSTWVDDEHVER